MSDPYRHQDGILPNFTQFPPQQGNPLSYRQIQQQLYQQQQQQQQIQQQLLLQQQQQLPYANYPYNNQFIQGLYQQPYIPNPMFYQSLPNPNRPISPFTELRGSILPPICPVFDPHPPLKPFNKFDLGSYTNRIVKHTRKEAAVIIQSYWRGYWVRKHVSPIIKRLRKALHNQNRYKNRELFDSVCKSLTNDLISEAVDVIVVNFIIDWLDYSAYLVLLDIECYVLRDNIIDDIIDNGFIEEIVQECLLEEISVELYNDVLSEEVMDVLLIELSQPSNAGVMKELTMNEIKDVGNTLDGFIMSELISSLDTQNYDLSRAREMQGVKDGLIMTALIRLLENVQS